MKWKNDLGEFIEFDLCEFYLHHEFMKPYVINYVIDDPMSKGDFHIALYRYQQIRSPDPQFSGIIDEDLSAELSGKLFESLQRCTPAQLEVMKFFIKSFLTFGGINLSDEEPNIVLVTLSHLAQVYDKYDLEVELDERHEIYNLEEWVMEQFEHVTDDTLDKLCLPGLEKMLEWFEDVREEILRIIREYKIRKNVQLAKALQARNVPDEVQRLIGSYKAAGRRRRARGSPMTSQQRGRRRHGTRKRTIAIRPKAIGKRTRNARKGRI